MTILRYLATRNDGQPLLGSVLLILVEGTLRHVQSVSETVLSLFDPGVAMFLRNLGDLLGMRPVGLNVLADRGKVTFQGKPVAIGQIRFCNPKAGIDVVESLKTDGHYVIITGSQRGLAEGNTR